MLQLKETARLNSSVRIKARPESFDTLTFITTSECGAACSHCLMNSGPTRHEMLSFEQMKMAIDRYASSDVGGRVVVFTGGECTRIGNDLLEAIAYANINGLPTRIVTNAEWATDESSTIKIIADLRSVGLDELNISCDDYHAQFIPIENVLRCWRLSKQKGFASVVLAICHNADSKITPESIQDVLGEKINLVYDENGLRSSRLPDPDSDGTRYLISNSSVLRIGRGCLLDVRPARQVNQRGILGAPCSPNNQQVVITPDFHVGACCGINPSGIGFLDFGPFSEDERESRFRDLVLTAIRMIGPGYLLDIVCDEDRGFPRRPYYLSPCEICSDISQSARALEILERNLDRIEMDLNAELYLASIFENNQGKNRCCN